MSGRYVRLAPGRYTLAVSEGQGPAGVHREGAGGVTLDIEGGRAEFTVADDERVYYWWRGPRERSGVRLLGVSRGVHMLPRAVDEWPTGTTG